MSQELEGTLTNSADLVGSFGSTGSGSNNYNDLVNKPSINNVELSGNKTGNQLGLVSDTDLATVATTGNYNDLLHKPTIPAAQVNSDWNAISGVARILNKPTIPTKTSDLTNDSGFITDSGLATVATTGDYDDLTNKPTIPAAQVNSDWDSTSGVSEILNKPTLSAVATSGSYNDLTDIPTIPTNSDFDLSGLGDVSISGATQGQVLTKGASSWEASDVIPAVTNDDLQTITPTASGITNYGQGSYYYQKGKLTFIHINVQGLTANSQTTIYTMPTGARPIKDVFACGLCGNSYTGLANISITTGGLVKVASVDNYASVYIVYVAA